jgi:hypothetical protein
VRLDELEAKIGEHDEAIRSIVAALRRLMAPPASSRRSRGFNPESDSRWASVTRRLAPMR